MGYDQSFLTMEVPLPTLSPAVAAVAFDGGTPIDHERFSVVFHRERGLAIATAHNIDGATLLAEGDIDRRDDFRFDPDVPRQIQIDNDRGYRNNRWDRGHLVRRRSLHWGDRAAAVEADRQSFFWTNIAPQHTRLHATAWGSIEDWMLERVEGDRKRSAVLTGPIFSPADPFITNAPGEAPFQLPAGFWKVLVIPHEDGHRLAAFLTWQRDFDSADPASFDPVLEQVRLTTIEYLTGLAFEPLRHLDPLRFAPATRGAQRRPSGLDADAVNIRGAADIQL